MIDHNSLEWVADSDAVQKILEDIVRNDSIQLMDAMVMFQKVLPIYPSLPKQSQVKLLSSISGSLMLLSQLVSFTASIPKEQNERNIYVRVLEDLLTKMDGCLLNCLRSSNQNKIDQKTLKAIFFGSKFFNIIASDTDIVWYSEKLLKQWSQVLELPLQELNDLRCGQYLLSMFKLHPTLTIDLYFGRLFFLNARYFVAFKTLLEQASKMDQKAIISSFFLPYLALHVTSSNYDYVYVLLKEFPHVTTLDLETILKIKSLLLKHILIFVHEKSNIKCLIGQLLSRFASIDQLADENICQLITIVLQSKLNRDEREQLSCEQQFLNSVTERLRSQDSVVRERTMFIAKLVTNGKLEYESNFTIDVPHLQLGHVNYHISDELLEKINYVSASSKIDNLSSAIREISVQQDSDDDDYEDYIDEQGRSILFLKDLVKAYEQIDKNSKSDIVPLFKTTVRLVRQKKHLPIEVDFYSLTLISTISLLNNNYDESGFEPWRINALVSIIVTVPEKVGDLLKILSNDELSLQQRMSTLTVLGLAARELKGHDDKTILKPTFDFPTKRLPWDTKKQEIQELPAICDNSIIDSGTTVWKSKKMDLQKRTILLKKDYFRPHAAKFFYPLAHAWLNGIDLGSFDHLFKTQYLSTLVIIYQCAFPANDYDSMTQIMNQIFLDASQQGLKLPAAPNGTI